MLFALLFAADIPGGDNLLTIGGLTTVGGGIIAWILKSAMPGLIERAGVLIDKFVQVVEKKDEQAKQERAQLTASFAEQLDRREETFVKLAENVAENTRAISALTTQIAAMQRQHETAPEPRPKSQGRGT